MAQVQLEKELGHHDLYQLVFIDKGIGQILKTHSEKDRERVKKGKGRVDLVEQGIWELVYKLGKSVEG